MDVFKQVFREAIGAQRGNCYNGRMNAKTENGDTDERTK